MQQPHNMNHRNLSIRELQELADKLPDYSLGEIFYSALRLTGASSIKDLKNVNDEGFYEAINKAKEVETE